MVMLPEASLSTLWKNDFTVDNLIDYARASIDLSWYIRVLSLEGFKHLVVPSRGAVPFLNAAYSAWNLDARRLSTYEERVKERVEIIGSAFTQQLVLPFSADPNDETQTTSAIRKYWSLVLAAIVRRDGTDRYLSSYKAMVEVLAQESWVNVLPRDLPERKFLFIDTVISGRAICEIIESFNEAGLDQCHFILIVDENGEKIAPPYRRIIDRLTSDNRCTLIPVKRLFTEDRGPAVSGVWSTVYPQVLDALRNRYSWAQAAYGAGTFYHRISSSQVPAEKGIGDSEYNMPVTRMYASLTIGIFTALRAIYDKEAEGRNSASPNQNLGSHAASQEALIDADVQRELSYHLHCFRQTIEELKPLSPLDKETTRLLAEPRVLAIHPNAEVNISSSHLVRVSIPQNEIDRFMRKLDSNIKDNANLFADDWFRNC